MVPSWLNIDLGGGEAVEKKKTTKMRKNGKKTRLSTQICEAAAVSLERKAVLLKKSHIARKNSTIMYLLYLEESLR